jgi:16S rRNA (guanine966-N2)-methyltransferase
MPISCRPFWSAPRIVANEVRIIGGAWRSRRIRFPDVTGLRPTPDRVRETLFNWLQGEIDGVRCLDLYAGSGALGFEAASRGASHVVAVDSHRKVCEALRHNCAALDARQIEIVQAEVGRFLSGSGRPFEIVFMDPPFRRGFLNRSCELLASRGWLADRAWIYLEAEAEQALDGLPSDWAVVRSKQAGEVGYHLFQRTQ